MFVAAGWKNDLPTYEAERERFDKALHAEVVNDERAELLRALGVAS